MFSLVLVALVLCVLFKVLNVNSSPEKSLFYCSNVKLLEHVMANAPQITQPYFPTRLWGFSGHVQTIIQGVVSRIVYPLVNGKRYYFVQPDETTVTYDLYQPKELHTINGDFTLLICPGICNSSESVYIKRVVCQAQLNGYRVAVLNHVGALKCVPLTGKRIFTYGNTTDYDGMVQDVAKRYPGSKLILIGFSMGGNIVTKYLGEKRSRPANIIAGISACQGYDAERAAKLMLEWENFRRLYLFAMTENIRHLLRRWQKELFQEDFKREKAIVEKDVWFAATLVELDDAYTRKIEGVDSVEELYHRSSCVNYFDGIQVPMVFINATDDPVVPPQLTNIIKEATKTHDNFIYIEQKYGGHLGFYEGGIVCPKPLSWLDRVVVSLADSLAIYSDSGKEKQQQQQQQQQSSPVSSEPSTPKLVIKARAGVVKKRTVSFSYKRQRQAPVPTLLL